jgi:hypothetical protein
MKADMFNAVMKTLGSTQDETTRAVINAALETVNEPARQKAEADLNNAMTAFSQAKAVHADNMLKLEEATRAITRNEQDIESSQKEREQAEKSWRTRFREVLGAMTPEMKAERYQQVADREIADDLIALKTEMVAGLREEKEQAEAASRESGMACINTHRDALVVYAQHEWSAAIQNISPALVRAFRLRLRAMQIKGEKQPHATLMAELGGMVFTQSEFYAWDMNQEPVISQLGLNRPELPGVDMSKYQTAAQQNTSWHQRSLAASSTRKEKEQAAARRARA